MHINCGKGILIVFFFIHFFLTSSSSSPSLSFCSRFHSNYMCVYVVFSPCFFLLIFVLFLILFWLFSQRSYPSMLRPLCYLMNMVLVTVLRHVSMKQRAKCPNWCLWKRVILFLLACVYGVCFFFHFMRAHKFLLFSVFCCSLMIDLKCIFRPNPLCEVQFLKLNICQSGHIL